MNMDMTLRTRETMNKTGAAMSYADKKEKKRISQTFPPKTSLASNNIGLWPASAKYFAVDKPAKPDRMSTIKI